MGITRQVDAQLSSKDSIKDVVQNLENNGAIGCVLVDDAQFFKKSQIEEMFEIAVNKNIPIICHGLRNSRGLVLAFDCAVKPLFSHLSKKEFAFV